MPAPSSTRTDAPAIRAEAVAKAFGGGVRALDGVSFSIAPGGLIALAGANGSGKSTLLKVLAGIVAPGAGTVEVLGRDPRRGRGELRAHVGYAGQDAALDGEMTGAETLRLFHALHALPSADRRGRLAALADDYGLGDFGGRPVATWSGGQRQRLHLALATLHAPRVLFLDEPTSSLDPDGRRDLWRRLAAMRDAGATVLVATHDLPDVAAHCDRVLLLHRGRVLADDSPAALVAAHARARAVVTLERDPGDETDGLRRVLETVDGAPEVAIAGAAVTLWRARNPDGADPALALLAARGIGWRAYERRDPDLAGAYFRLTGDATASAPPEGARRGGGGTGGRGTGGGRGRR
jgi:ABC-2 type transport system ATP-binding protein